MKITIEGTPKEVKEILRSAYSTSEKIEREIIKNKKLNRKIRDRLRS